MIKVPYTINTKTELTQEDLDNIVDAAVDFCSYWCDLLEIGTKPTEKITAMSEVVTRGGTLVFHIDEPFEEGGKKKFTLTALKMVAGLENYPKFANRQFNFEDYDGPEADAALQLALFSEVVYG